MTVRDNIAEFISFFRGKTVEIGQIQAHPIYRKILGAVLDNEIYLRWRDEEQPDKLAQATAAY